MLLLLSPAKTLDESRLKRDIQPTQPRFLPQTAELVAQLQQHTEAELSRLMGISDKLAALNAARYRDFHLPLTEENAKPALFAFKGDVYIPIRAMEYNDETLAFANAHLRILSGLYGLLRPLDYLYPYRLEMGTRLETPAGKTLYQFWGTRITDAINEDMRSLHSTIVLNLASEEYSKAVQPDRLDAAYVTAEFRERKGDTTAIVGIHAKRARGLMADYILRHRITTLVPLQDFNVEGYRFEAAMSDTSRLVFVREQPIKR
jgi:uncharacterized protein